MVHEGLSDNQARMLGAPVGSAEPLLQGYRDRRDAHASVRLGLRNGRDEGATPEREGPDRTGTRMEFGETPPGRRAARAQFRPREYGRLREVLPRRLRRVERPRYQGNFLHFGQDLSRLEAMNTFLSHGLLDVGELNQMQFRNRSLQEFLAAVLGRSALHRRGRWRIARLVISTGRSGERGVLLGMAFRSRDAGEGATGGSLGAQACNRSTRPEAAPCKARFVRPK